MSSQFGNEDAIGEALSEADVPTLRQLKGVSQGWRARARRVLWARLCRREGQPVPTSPADVTDIDVKPCLKTIGPGVAHVTEAMARLPNLARMHAHGFVVDVAAVRGLGPAPAFNGNRDAPNDVLQPVRGCIRGEGEPPGGLLLAVRAARYGEAHVPNGAFYDCSSLARVTLPARGGLSNGTRRDVHPRCTHPVGGAHQCPQSRSTRRSELIRKHYDY